MNIDKVILSNICSQWDFAAAMKVVTVRAIHSEIITRQCVVAP